MKRLKLTLLFLMTIFVVDVSANPTFARQYSMDCSACHSQAPALNDMGLSFIRNGFRTSSYDTPALAAMLDENSTKRHYPVGAMIGLSDSSDSGEVNKIVKLYLSGTLTDSLSLMATSKETFNSKKQDEELFTSQNSQLYLQYNIQEAKHAFRVGLMKPLTQLGNVKRSMANSGLNGGADHGDRYFSPLQHANIKQIEGVEYSYLFDNNLLVLFSYGDTIDGENKSSQNSNFNQNQHGGLGNTNNFTNQHNNLLMNGLSDSAYLIGLNYRTSSNYKIGLIYSHTNMIGEDYDSVIVPVEKEYEKFILNSSLVYAEYGADEYIGLETALTFPLRDMEHVKAIFNIDKDENSERNIGYSLGYTRIFDMFSVSVVASQVDAVNYENKKLMGAINFIF